MTLRSINSLRTNLFSTVLLSLFSSLITANANGQIITTVAGKGTKGYSGDGGPAIAAQLSGARGLAADNSGNLFIADWTSVRKVAPSGIITTIAGNGTACDSVAASGIPATSTKVCPYKITVDAAGNLYILDHDLIRKVDAAGIISTIAGGGSSNSDGIPATAADLWSAEDIMFDAGNIYVGTRDRLRMVNTSTGIISTIAGIYNSIGFSGDGGLATAAKVDNIAGVVKDAGNNIYILERGNMRVRKIDAAGIITTYAGNGNIGYSGDGGAAVNAEFYFPLGLGIDAYGNLYVADRDANVVRMITPSGTISSIAGVWIPGHSGDGGPSIIAQLNQPLHVTAANGNVYIADEGNRRVRKIAGIAGIEHTVLNNRCSVFPNPSNGYFTVTIPYSNARCTATVYNLIGQIVYQRLLPDSSNDIDLTGVAKGVYFLKVESEKNSVVQKIAVE